MEKLKKLRRIEHNDYPLYILPEQPYWFVPNKAGDTIIKTFIETGDIYSAAKTLDLKFSSQAIAAETFIESILKKIEDKVYTGRGEKVECTYPKEVWLHITNRCNLKCRHCLFSEHLNDGLEIEKSKLIFIIDSLLDIGTNVFIFTGGEPLVYQEIVDIVRYIHTKSRDSKVAFLTNGIPLKNLYTEFQSKCDVDRLHFQLSCEGTFQRYENIRGVSFESLLESIKILINGNFNFTLGVDLLSKEFDIEFFMKMGVKNFHFLYHIPNGNGKNFDKNIVTAQFESLYKYRETAKKYNANIDNFYSIATQVFTYPNLKHDLTSAGIESFAIGPDLKVYPTAATIFIQDLCCGDILTNTLSDVWINSATLRKLRELSVKDIPDLKYDDWKFINGGGDLDLSFFYSGEIFGKDPFIQIYNNIIKSMIVEEAAIFDKKDKLPRILFETGDRIEDCGKKGEVFLTHSNCLLTFATSSGIEAVQSFYKRAAINENVDILNPFIENLRASNIPEENISKSYGCGSPVNHISLKRGDYILDLGSGSGVETLIAADLVGDIGCVVGIDMLDEMLTLSQKAKNSKGAKNITYIKGFIENLPFSDDFFNFVMSNCVINLSHNKKMVFREIFRILKNSGKMVVSDVVSEKTLPISFLQNDKLKGECLSGSMTEEQLFDSLALVGFKNIKVLSRVPYRVEQGFKFFSLTFSAQKFSQHNKKTVYYPGPSRYFVNDDLQFYRAGSVNDYFFTDEDEDTIFITNNNGAVTNKDMISCCVLTPESKADDRSSYLLPDFKNFYETGCLICGRDLVYHDYEKEERCFICGKVSKTSVKCENGHFICDECHYRKPIFFMKKNLINSDERDMLKIFEIVRNNSFFPMHGPEYHSFVPGIILTAYRNNGGKIDDSDIIAGIDRGGKIPGGSCGFMGVCGVATGVGVGLSVIMKSNPLKPEQRSKIMDFSSQVLKEIANFNAPRCCQRETFIGLKLLSEISAQLLGISLPAQYNFKCRQHSQNSSCIGKKCPLFEGNVSGWYKKEFIFSLDKR